MDINVIGGGWVVAGSTGRMRTGKLPALMPGNPEAPSPETIFSPPPVRYGRFDSYSRLGYSAMALALKDAGLEPSEGRGPVGIIVSSIYDCFETDLAFYETVREEDGLFASPNLFSYTLPGIVIGETAIRFGLTGPTFTVGDSVDERGYSALETSVGLITGGICETALAGWVDSQSILLKQKVEKDRGIRGAVFVALSSAYPQKRIKKIEERNGGLFVSSGTKIRVLGDLFS